MEKTHESFIGASHENIVVSILNVWTWMETWKSPWSVVKEGDENFVKIRCESGQNHNEEIGVERTALFNASAERLRGEPKEGQKQRTLWVLIESWGTSWGEKFRNSISNESSTQVLATDRVKSLRPVQSRKRMWSEEVWSSKISVRRRRRKRVVERERLERKPYCWGWRKGSTFFESRRWGKEA